jgi:chemotaxis protein MotA
MDLASTIGFLLAVAFMAVSVVMGGGSMGAFVDVPSIVVTIGGSLATVMIMFPLRSMFALPKVAMKVFLNKVPDQKQLIELLVSLAETARRDGLLSLERRLPEIDNPFVVRGLQMAIDGTDASVVEAVLRTEMEAVNDRNKDGKALFDQIGKMGPAFGMIGTLLGLILMLGNLSDPDALGPGHGRGHDHHAVWRRDGQRGLHSSLGETELHQPAASHGHGDCRPRHPLHPRWRQPPRAGAKAGRLHPAAGGVRQKTVAEFARIRNPAFRTNASRTGRILANSATA